MPEVILLDSWLGHPKNSKVNVPIWKAQEMIDRGVAQMQELETKEEGEGVKKMTQEVTPKKKKMGRPPKNKMIKSSKNK